CAALVIAAVFVGGCDGIYTLRDYLYDRSFVPVADITGIPAEVDAGLPFPLFPVIVPGDATNRAVAWSVSDPGTTGAAITGGVFRAEAAGPARDCTLQPDAPWSSTAPGALTREPL
ncbi:MAG: hypothetical protein LBR23_08760, partial [Spirochaetaceae bacterium]|nr:hypothetical protein [Spirochaetaceae bacterium]